MKQLQTIRSAIQNRAGFFSHDQIVAETHLPRRLVREALDQLERDGLVTKSRRLTYVYRANRAEQGEAIVRNRMWSVIRSKAKTEGYFTRRDLVLLAQGKKENARSFLRALKRAGIIVPSKPTGRGLFWRLLRDPGPNRPYLGKLETKGGKHGETIWHRHPRDHRR
jgi:ribosomal protein S19E (S16A)